ncbi:MAG: cobalt transporter CbiM [Methanomassiliicoccus sp.]|nr:cobalt transporter CbiM [Methanomassiliicoccus sp.]
MHIPDGYLGPATWGILFLVMLVIWFFAFRNANKNLGPRNVPMLSFMAALSFILMMFNLPIPDGTTAHMVGAVLAAIVLGPYGATIALSIALLIQALLFGDGGITAFGANVFNMGVVMPFTGILAYVGVKKLLERGKMSIPGQRAVAAFVGGYVGLNLAALCAAIEFGLQPAIAPGYAPYGLDVAIPAMVSVHLLVGIVEGLATAAVVYYLADHRPDLLQLKKLAPNWMQGMLKEDLGKASQPVGKKKAPAEVKGGN